MVTHSAVADSGVDLTVMTYNLRFASETPPNAWSERRALLVQCIRKADPDVLGTQEGVYAQLRDIEADLTEYAWIGLGREGGSRGEFMAVFYRQSRLEPVAFDHFWLSDTPHEIGSKSWGNRIPRMVTCVRFRDLTTGTLFVLWNTHFDHESQPAREKSAALLRERILSMGAAEPAILVGDFNAAAGVNPVHGLLTEGAVLRDAWDLAERRSEEGWGTFNGFGETPRGGARIDWILVRGVHAVRSAEILTYPGDGRYPSDHFPVVTRLRLTQTNNPETRR